MWESLRDLSKSYRDGMITQECFDGELVDLIDCHNKLDEAIEKVNFYEEL
jgi:hypothetical protein